MALSTYKTGGVTGGALTTALAEADEVQPDELVTVNVKVVLATKPVTVSVVPLPANEPEGEPVTVQLPVAGKLLNTTLPVAVKQVG